MRLSLFIAEFVDRLENEVNWNFNFIRAVYFGVAIKDNAVLVMSKMIVEPHRRPRNMLRWVPCDSDKITHVLLLAYNVIIFRASHQPQGTHMGNRKPRPNDKPKAFATLARRILKDRKLTQARFCQIAFEKSDGELRLWQPSMGAMLAGRGMPTNRWPIIFAATLDLTPARRDQLIAAARKDCENWGAKRVVQWLITERFLLPYLPRDDAPAASPPEYPSSPASP